MTRNAVITDWKRIWSLVSAINHETPEKTVYEELKAISKELESGLMQFITKNASDVKLDKLLKDKKQENLLSFTHQLQELLNLGSEQCWEILCYYLTNEYRGSAGVLVTLTSTETSTTDLLDDVFGYFSLNRMIILKIVKNLLTFYKEVHHPYQRQYKDIVDKLTLVKIRESYLKQFEYLVKEQPPSKLLAGHFFNHRSKLTMWAERNAREINEVAHILLLLCEHLPLDLKQIEALYDCLNQHSFGKDHQQYFEMNNAAHVEIIRRLTYSEVALFLKCLDLTDSEADTKLAKDLNSSLGKYISRMGQKQDDGPILLSWMLLQVRSSHIEEEDASLVKLRQFGKRALELHCFDFLKDLVSNEMFQDDSLVSRIVRRTVYNLLTCLCDLFDADGSCATHFGIYELLAALLSWPTLAKEFCQNEEGGVRSLYNTLLEMFPTSFEHLSMVAAALCKAGMYNYVKLQLESLPIFTEIYDFNKFNLYPVTGDSFKLSYDYRPFPGINFTIKSGTMATIMQRSNGVYVHFRCEVDYFRVLHHLMNRLLAESGLMSSENETSLLLKRIETGLSFLELALLRMKALDEITEAMVHPTEICVDVLNRFKSVPEPPVALFAKCLRVCTALLPLAEREIHTRMTNLNMLPVVLNATLNDYEKYVQGIGFDSRMVGTYLVDIERKNECYDLLLAYLGYVRRYVKLQRNNFYNMEIPAVIFLLREVLPHLHSWRFRRPNERYMIYAETMGFICEILDNVLNTKTIDNDAAQQMLRNICVYSLLNLENGLMLLRFVAVGNAFLQHTMEMDSNWMLQRPHSYTLLVRLAIRILMQLLRLRHSVFEGRELSPLESMIYSQPKHRDSLRIIPIVTSYMNNIFDRWLPILSCRLLKRIALEFDMTLLACLDMKPDQIRLTFLQKLPDDLESDSLKIAILEFVDACIEKQPGVTECFFKVETEQEKRIFGGKEFSTPIADSIITYLEDYLEAVGKEPQTVQHQLPSKVMNIFHSLWKHNMQNLVEDLRRKDKFWQRFCNPLFVELPPNVRAHTQLIKIMSIEIFSTAHQPNEDFKKVLLKFFEARHFDKWLRFLYDLPETPYTTSGSVIKDLMREDLPEWLCRLQSFKSFIIILLRKQPEYIDIPSQQLKSLAEMTLKTLVGRIKYVEDLRPFILLTELYLFVLSAFKHAYTETPAEHRAMLSDLVQLLGHMVPCYEDMHARAKEACLSLTIQCAALLAAELLEDSDMALSLMHSIVAIICIELQRLETSICAESLTQSASGSSGGSDSKKDNTAVTQHFCESVSKQSLILTFNLLKTVASIFHNEGPGNWDLPFISNKVFQRLLSCASSILHMASKQQLSLEILEVLIVFAKGNCSVEFLHCDVDDYLFLKLLPPKELVRPEFSVGAPQSSESWSMEMWWPVYARGIEFITTLFQKHKCHFLKEMLQFVGIHERYLADSMLLSLQTMKPVAVNLVKSAITLLSEMVPYEKQWRLDNAQSMFSLLRTVQSLMGHSISMFHQPRSLKSLVLGQESQLAFFNDTADRVEQMENIVNAFNDLLEIIVLCCKCLLHYSPDLLDLLCAPEFSYAPWEHVFEMNFGVPKLDQNDVRLTFGTVLSIVGVYTKVLNLQNYAFNEIPLNEIPQGGDASKSENGRAAAKHAGRSTSQTKQHTFSKSVSLASVSSAVYPPNELLANLDAELCLMALEHILMLVASQSMLVLKHPHVPTRDKTLIKREISSELLSFQEYVRKKVLAADHREHKDMWLRTKHGQVYMHALSSNDDSEDDGIEQATTSATARASPSQRADTARTSADLRINVVRRLHLQHTAATKQQQQQKHINPTNSSFDMSQAMSPISSRTPAPEAGPVSSTPNLMHLPTRRPGEVNIRMDEVVKRVTFNLPGEEQPANVDEPDAGAGSDDAYHEHDNDTDNDFLPSTEPAFSPLSYVQLVEEDYLHFMSNLFFVICQSD